MNQTSVLFLPHGGRGCLVRFGRSVAWAEEVDSTPWALPLVWLVYRMNRGRQSKLKRSKLRALLYFLYIVVPCRFCPGGGATPVCLECRSGNPPSGFTVFFFSGCSTGCYSIFSSTPSCLYINRKTLFLFVYICPKKREKKKKMKPNLNRMFLCCDDSKRSD